MGFHNKLQTALCFSHLYLCCLEFKTILFALLQSLHTLVRLENRIFKIDAAEAVVNWPFDPQRILYFPLCPRISESHWWHWQKFARATKTQNRKAAVELFNRSTRILIGEMCGVRWCSAATVGPNVHAQLLLCLLHLKAIDALEFHWDTCIYTCIYTRIYTETVWQTAASTTFMFQRLPLCVCACAAFETRWLHFFTPSWTRGARRAAWAHCSQGFSDAIFFFFLAFSAMKIFGIIQIFQKNKKIKKMRLGSVWLCVCRIKC